MRNPLENEETAFRFVIGTIAYLVPIVVASWIAAWLGVVVFVLATGVAIALLCRGTKPSPAAPPAGRAAVADTPDTDPDTPESADGGTGGSAGDGTAGAP